MNTNRDSSQKVTTFGGRPRRKGRAGWIPTYHGAWAMITVPILLGITIGGPVWEHALLLGLWWVGYFAFYATGLWLRSRRRPSYFPPVRAYVLATLPFGVALAVTSPFLLWWIPVFLPLIAVTVWASIHRKDRSILNDAATVSAASLTLPVAYDLGTHHIVTASTPQSWDLPLPGPLLHSTVTLPGTSADASLTGWAWIWLVTLIVSWYFLGTVFYVKTNIRERGKVVWYIASILFHGSGLVLVSALAGIGVLSWWMFALWVIIATRAAAVPAWGYHRTWLSPLALGLGEVALSIALFAIMLA